MAENEPKVVPPKWALVLNTVLSVFIACVVFAVIAKLMIVPQIAKEEMEIRQLAAQNQALSAQIVAMQGELDGLTAKPEVAPSPAPTAASGAPAAAPGTPAAQAAPPSPSKP